MGFSAGPADDVQYGDAIVASVGDDGERLEQSGQEVRDCSLVGSLAGGEQDPHRQAVLIEAPSAENETIESGLSSPTARPARVHGADQPSDSQH